MRVTVAAIGRLKDGAERELVDRYTKRFGQIAGRLKLGPLKITDFPESRAQTAEQRRSDESERLRSALEAGDHAFVLTETGQQWSSEQFAGQIARMRDDGDLGIAFLIGGPDGHDPALAKAANAKRLSLGKLTLPHGIARIVLLEQLYRAATILSGHPYHRGSP